MSDGFWMSFFAFVTFLATQWITYRKAEMAEKAARAAGVSVVAASTVNEKALKVVAKDLKEVKVNVVTIEKATNSLTDRLVAATAAENLARGSNEERARADERAKLQ